MLLRIMAFFHGLIEKKSYLNRIRSPASPNFDKKASQTTEKLRQWSRFRISQTHPILIASLPVLSGISEPYDPRFESSGTLHPPP